MKNIKDISDVRAIIEKSTNYNSITSNATIDDKDYLYLKLKEASKQKQQ